MSDCAPLPWQDGAWRQLQRASADRRLAHAWLVSGAGGIGKRTFIRAWTASLLCEQPLDRGLACGSCRSCVQRAAGSHPNLLWVQAEVDEKTGREKRDIGVEQLRRMMERLQLSSNGQPKVAVLDPADALNSSGANAVLKTIEEPPPDCLIILVSERPMMLAATLRSRCRRLDFHRPSVPQALAWLSTAAAGKTVTADALQEAGGAPLRLLSWMESGLADKRRSWRNELLDVALSDRDPMVAAAAISKDRDEVQAWLSGLLSLLASLLRLRALPEARAGHDDAGLRALALRLPGPALEVLIDETCQSLRRLGANAQPQLLVESLMIAWWRWTRPRREPAARQGLMR